MMLIPDDDGDLMEYKNLFYVAFARGGCALAHNPTVIGDYLHYKPPGSKHLLKEVTL